MIEIILCLLYKQPLSVGNLIQLINGLGVLTTSEIFEELVENKLIESDNYSSDYKITEQGKRLVNLIELSILKEKLDAKFSNKNFKKIVSEMLNR